MEFAGAFLPGGVGKGPKALNVVEEGADYSSIGRGAARSRVTIEMLSNPETRVELAEEIARVGRQHATSMTETSVDTTTSFTRSTYKSGFKAAHPEAPIAQVHHTIEQQLRTAGLFTEDEIHALSALRGMSQGSTGTPLHQGVIRMVYNNTYETASAEGRELTRADVLGTARAVDECLGHHFIPPIPSARKPR